ncbi:hypothetical protein Tco_0184893 [Tanacetum coccineum]
MAPRWKSRSTGPLRSSCLYLLLPTVGPPSEKESNKERDSLYPVSIIGSLYEWVNSLTSIPKAKKEEQELEVVLSRPSSSATTTVVVSNGDPPFRKGAEQSRITQINDCFENGYFLQLTPCDAAGKTMAFSLQDASNTYDAKE